MSLTTNGIGLARTAQALADAGLDRVNVSLDTLDRERFAQLARRDRLADVLPGLEAAEAAGLEPVKVNTVLMRGVNDDEAVPLLRWALAPGYQLRFIEQMPLDAQHGWDRDEMVTADEILGRLAEAFTLTPVGADERGSAPAEEWLVDGGPARVGVIGRVTRPFCGACDRVRLTADGQIRNCLFAREESDLRGPMRAGASDDELAARMRAALLAKKAGHGIDDPGFLQPVPADVSDRRLTRALVPGSAERCAVSRRKPRTSRNSLSGPRCSSQVVQVLRRSGVCSLGLFHASTQTASARQPFGGADGDSSPGWDHLSRVPPSQGRCRAATGGAARHRVERAPDGRPGSLGRSIARIDVIVRRPAVNCLPVGPQGPIGRSSMRSRPLLANTTDR